MPDGLREHLRYPEDLFRAQTEQYAQYHMTDPSDFFQQAAPVGRRAEPGRAARPRRRRDGARPRQQRRPRTRRSHRGEPRSTRLPDDAAARASTEQEFVLQRRSCRAANGEPARRRSSSRAPTATTTGSSCVYEMPTTRSRRRPSQAATLIESDPRSSADVHAARPAGLDGDPGQRAAHPGRQLDRLRAADLRRGPGRGSFPRFRFVARHRTATTRCSARPSSDGARPAARPARARPRPQLGEQPARTDPDDPTTTDDHARRPTTTHADDHADTTDRRDRPPSVAASCSQQAAAELDAGRRTALGGRRPRRVPASTSTQAQTARRPGEASTPRPPADDRADQRPPPEPGLGAGRDCSGRSGIVTIYVVEIPRRATPARPDAESRRRRWPFRASISASTSSAGTTPSELRLHAQEGHERGRRPARSRGRRTSPSG